VNVAASASDDLWFQDLSYDLSRDPWDDLSVVVAPRCILGRRDAWRG
jgi:hypothetical protein